MRATARGSVIPTTVCVGNGCAEFYVRTCPALEDLSWCTFRRLGNRCNLHYADDLLVLTMDGLDDMRIIKLILLVFEGVSGLATNFAKTCLYSSYLGELPEPEAAGTLNCERGLLPIMYLGIPIPGRRLRKLDWEGLISKIRKRLSSWKVKHLSLGGRLTLVNSVLSAIPTY